MGTNAKYTARWNSSGVKGIFDQKAALWDDFASIMRPKFAKSLSEFL